MGDVVAEARAASRADAWRHIEPLVAEVARLRSVVAGVEALVKQHEQFAAAQEAGPPIMADLAKTNRAFAHRLRSVLSDTIERNAQ